MATKTVNTAWVWARMLALLGLVVIYLVVRAERQANQAAMTEDLAQVIFEEETLLAFDGQCVVVTETLLTTDKAVEPLACP